MSFIRRRKYPGIEKSDAEIDELRVVKQRVSISEDFKDEQFHTADVGKSATDVEEGNVKGLRKCLSCCRFIFYCLISCYYVGKEKV